MPPPISIWRVAKWNQEMAQENNHIPIGLTSWKFTPASHANQGQGESPDTHWIEEASEARLKCTLPHFWHHVPSAHAHIHPQPVENGLDNVYWKRLQFRLESTLMHYDSQSWLAAISQMALGIWFPSKEQKQPYANALTRWQPQGQSTLIKQPSR